MLGATTLLFPLCDDLVPHYELAPDFVAEPHAHASWVSPHPQFDSESKTYKDLSVTIFMVEKKEPQSLHVVPITQKQPMTGWV